MATVVPTIRGSSQLRPHSAMSPRRAKAVINGASAAMNRTSQHKAIGTAIPATAPLIAATTGFFVASRYVYSPLKSSFADELRGTSSSGQSPPRAPPSVRVVRSPMSAPAQNARPAPVIDDADDGPIVLGPPHGVADLGRHAHRPPVQRLGPVQRDGRDRDRRLRTGSARTCQRPSNRGSRFSMKAATPSR